MQDTNMDTTQVDSTEASTPEVQTQEQKTFTQDQVNDIVAKRIAQVNQKYAQVDVNEYQELKTLQQQQMEQEMIKKQEFEKVLKQQKESSTKEVTQLRGELEKIKVDGALINAAASAGSVNPEHIAQLLRTNVRMDANGSVEVVDSEGNIRYTDNADPMGVQHLVSEFLDANTYYRAAGKPGTGSESSATPQSAQSGDLESLDLSRPDHRAIYAQWKREGKI